MYVAWLDDCAWAHSISRGISPELCRSLNRGMAVWRTQINYIGAAWRATRSRWRRWPVYNDCRLRIDRRFQIQRRSDGETLLRALMHYVCIDLQTGKAKRMPPEFTAIHGGACRDGSDRLRDATLTQPGVETRLAKDPPARMPVRMKGECHARPMDQCRSRARSMGSSNYTRRQILVTSLAAGFALAVQPVSAETRSRRTPKGSRPVKCACRWPMAKFPPIARCPPRARASPSCWWCRKSSACTSTSRTCAGGFAKAGLSRRRARAVRAAGRRVEDDRLQADHRRGRLESARRAGHGRPRCDRRVGREVEQGRRGASSASPASAGAGASSWLYAAHNPKLKAGVAWYGRLTGRQDRACSRSTRSTSSPSSRRRCWACTAARTRASRWNRSSKCVRRSTRRRSRSKIVVFPDAPHGFHADYRPSYNPEEAAAGWKQCLEWFREHGVG